MKKQRFISEYGLSNYDADVLTAESKLATYYEVVAKESGEPKLAANWVMVELSAQLNKSDLTIAQSPINPKQLAGLILRIKDNTISGKQAKQAFEEMWKRDVNISIQGVGAKGEVGDIDVIIERLGLKQVSDTGAVEKIVSDIVDANPEQVEQYRAADEGKRKKLLGFFVGQIMKASKGQANPGVVNEILLKKLEG